MTIAKRQGPLHLSEVLRQNRDLPKVLLPGFDVRVETGPRWQQGVGRGVGMVITASFLLVILLAIRVASLLAVHLATLMIACFPLFAALACARYFGSTVQRITANIVGIMHAVFFISGVLSLWAQGNASPFAGGVTVSDESIFKLVFNTAVVGAAFIFGLSGLAQRRPRVANGAGAEAADPPRSVVLYSQLVGLIAIVGLAEVVIQSGGVTGAAQIWRTHDFDSAAGSATLGLTLWVTFAVPAVILISRSVWQRRGHGLFLVATLEIVVIVFAQLYIFGSRLGVVQAAIGITIYRLAVTGKNVRAWQVTAGLILFVLASTFVLNGRAELKNTTSTASTTDVLGYGIVDVAVASSLLQPQLADAERDPERYLTLVESTVPGPWPDAALVSQYRFDRIVGRTVVFSANSSDYALPTSLPVTFWVSWGLFVGAGIALVVGVGANRLFYFAERRTRNVAAFGVSLISVSLVNAYKGGDLPLDFASSLRLALELGVLALPAVAIARFAKQQPDSKRAASVGP